MEVKSCRVCHHPETSTINRFLRLAPGTKGRRGPRSLAKPMGLDRRDLARHERECLATSQARDGGA
jgi:hypothetical protein